LYDEEQMAIAEDLISTFKNIGYHSFMLSAKTGFQCEELKGIMKDKVNLFSGHSGVGKSALINRLDSNLNVRVGDISEVHEKGKHTTTFSQMFPLSFGGYIIDSPGIKEFGLYDMEKDTLAQRFPEMRSLMHECKFSNCTHLHEPHCAIKEAVEQNLIADWRYIDYCNMMED
jgi:ribosome biogenesis GTPase